jgi:hypothetical protein
VTSLALATGTANQLIAAGAVVTGAIIGGLITLFTTRQQNQHAREERETAAQAARRARAAEILGRVRTFLTDAHPERIGFNVNPETTPKVLEALKVRLNTLRDELSIFAAGADDDRVLNRAAELEVSLFNTVHSVSWHASDLLSHRDLEPTYSQAMREHLRASILVRIVLDLTRGRDTAELEAELHRVDEQSPGATGADQGGPGGEPNA